MLTMEGKQQINSHSKNTAVSKTFEVENRIGGPDVGYAWVVAVSACMINFIMAGLNRVSGVLFMAFIEVYGVDRKTATVPFSVRSSAGNLFGPIVGILGQKYGARRVIVLGGTVGAVSAAACFFTPDVTWITVLWGGVNGVGAALTVTLPQVVIGQYFEKYRTTAVGLAFSGGCVGSFIFPAVVEYSIHTYGIEGTFLILGAIIVHCVPAALILKKPTWLKAKIIKTSDIKTDLTDESSIYDFKTKSSTNSTPICLTPAQKKLKDRKMSLRFSVKSVNECTPKRTPTSIKSSTVYPNIKLLRQNNVLVEKILTQTCSNAGDQVTLQDFNQNESTVMDIIEELHKSLKISAETPKIHKDSKSAKSTLFTNDIECVTPTFSSRKFSFTFEKEMSVIQSPDTKANLQSLTTVEDSKKFILNRLSQLDDLDVQFTEKSDSENLLPVLAELRKLNKLCPRVEIEVVESIKSETLKESTTEQSSGKNSATLLDHIKTAFELYLNPLFIMVCLCRAVHFIAFIPAMTTVVDFSIDKGFPEEEGKYAIAAISLGDLLGRLCLGWVTDRGYMTLPKYMMVVMIMQGISTASLPLMHTQITLFATLAVFGMLQGSLFVRHSVLVSKYLRLEEQSIAMGCVNFFSGLIGFGLPLYIGFFRDTMGSYDLIFYINGVLGAFVGLLWTFEPFFVRYVNSKRTTQKIV